MSLMAQKNHGLVCSIITVLTIMCAILLYPRQNYPMSHMVLPLQKQMPTYPRVPSSQITLYPHMMPGMKKLALITIERYALAPNPNIEQAIGQKMQQLAAGVGANGLVMRYGGFSQGSGAEAVITAYNVQFLAVRVPPGVASSNAWQLQEPSIVTPHQGGVQ